MGTYSSWCSHVLNVFFLLLQKKQEERWGWARGQLALHQKSTKRLHVVQQGAAARGGRPRQQDGRHNPGGTKCVCLQNCSLFPIMFTAVHDPDEDQRRSQRVGYFDYFCHVKRYLFIDTWTRVCDGASLMGPCLFTFFDYVFLRFPSMRRGLHIRRHQRLGRDEKYVNRAFGWSHYVLMLCVADDRKMILNTLPPPSRPWPLGSVLNHPRKYVIQGTNNRNGDRRLGRSLMSGKTWEKLI